MKKYIKKTNRVPKKPNGHWNIKKNCVVEAQKYATLRDWQKGSPGSLGGAYRNGWLSECVSHMANNKTQMIDYENSEKKRVEETKQRIEVEKEVLNFLGMGKKELFFQDDV